MVVGSHGVRGDLKIRVTSDDPDHLLRLKRVYLGDETAPRRVLAARLHAGHLLLRVDGIATPEEAAARRGEAVRIAGDQARPLAKGEYYLYQVIGLDAVDEAGLVLGRVTDLIETGAHDVFVVTPAGGGADILLPNHPEVVLDVRPTEGTMIVRPLVYE